jgi:hypothetical protein
LLVDKVDEPEVFVEEATVVLDARLKVGYAHVLVALSLQAPQERLFSECGQLDRQGVEAFECLRGGRLLKFYGDPGSMNDRGAQSINQSINQFN